MSINYTFATLLILFIFTTISSASLVKQQPLILKYHNGQLLKGKLSVNLIWYGKFTPIQRSIIIDFIQSLSSTKMPQKNPSAASWWKTTEKYKGGPALGTTLVLGNQLFHENYPLGKVLKNSHIIGLGSKRFTAQPNNNKNVNTMSLNIVLTAQDVVVDGFCMRCGSHGSVGRGTGRLAYIWVGNSATQCAGQCAWPFYKPIYGPQTSPLISPNNDIGVDGMIINLATLLAGTVTNPFKDGYFQGPLTAPLEAVSACTGVFGSGAYPGYPGNVLVDKVSGASFNAYGVNGRKFLLPAMWDPKSFSCSTLV